MTGTMFSRRGVLLGASAAFGAMAAPRLALAAQPAMQVLKDPGCGCCEAWVRILRDEGFDVSVEHMTPGLIMRRKIALGVPDGMAGCHTGLIAGYAIEGHVPVADIRRLLDERPDAVGLSVPGMPYGSPGMGPEDEREAYDVFLIGRDGETEAFSTYEAA